MESQLDVFNKLILDLENIDVTIDDEDQALLLLCALPKSFSHFKETLLNGRESLSLVEVQSALNSKELNERNEQKASVSGEGLIVGGKRTKKDNHLEKKKSKPQSENSGNVPNIRCYHCKKEGHTQRFCPERQNGYNSHRSKEGGNAMIVQDGYESAEALMVSSGKSDGKWIMDSGCLFHMTPNKPWFEKFTELQGGSVLLGNSKPCKI